MVTPATFQKAEDEFFLLRGKLQAGRITREQFELAVKGLTIQDDQGRYWTIGGNTGKWYIYDGRVWVEATPPGTPGAPDSLPPPPELSRAKTLGTARLIGLALVSVLVLTGTIALLFASSRGVLRYDLGSPRNIAKPAVTSPTLPPATRLPAFTPMVAVVALPSATAPLSAVPPTAQPMTAPSFTLAATALPTISPTSPPAPSTASPAVPTATLWPGLFVIGLEVDPPQPKDRQPPTFKVTFLNTLGQIVQYRWFVKIFRPEEKQSFGETAKTKSDIPPGTTVWASVPNWKGPAGEPCNPFIARVFYQAPDNTIFEFPTPGGDNFSGYFSVCQ